MSTSSETPKKTIKLVVSPQYHSLGYQDYTAIHNVSEPLSILKSAGSSTRRFGEMSLLFRGRKITSEEENISFESLMKKFHVSEEEDVLVFHGVITNVPPTALQSHTASTQQSASSQIGSTSRRVSGYQPTRIQTTQPPESTPPAVTPSNSTTPSVQSPYQSMRVSVQTPAAAQQAIQQTLTQLTANPPIRPNVQVIPIQYQAILINGLPLLAQLGRPSQIRLTSDTVIPVITHEGQQALIVSPAGVASLAQQGYRVEVRVFAQQQFQQLQPALQNIQPQIPPPFERRFGLTDFVSLFRRRLGQQLWLLCKLAFMVGIFSSNNASWRRIIGLCIVAAGIFFWQTGALERWARRFRRPLVQLPAQPQPEREYPPQQQEGAMANITAGFRLAEQVLFVFVASLWPNAVGGGEHVPLEMLGEGGNNPRPQGPAEQARQDGDEIGDEGGNEDAEQERIDVIVA